jgi:SAM-dependent methyltransferase
VSEQTADRARRPGLPPLLAKLAKTHKLVLGSIADCKSRAVKIVTSARSTSEALDDLLPRYWVNALDDSLPRDWVNGALTLIERSSMRPSQKVTAARIVRSTCADHLRVAGLPAEAIVVHDELLLHRAFSILPHSSPDAVDADASWYFAEVPAPDAAIVFSAPVETIIDRVSQRAAQHEGKLFNVYAGAVGEDLAATVERSLRVCRAAVEELGQRGTPVFELDNGGGVGAGADQLASYLEEAISNNEHFAGRLRGASGSFRRGTGRYTPRTQHAAYASFRTPILTVTPAEAQRNTQRRIARFGLTPETAGGKSVLDLGANVGAMLFELTLLGISSGLGIEFDRDKVDLAADIADRAGLDNLRFAQGDIDELDAGEIGQFDIVLALAIEGHVQRRERLFEVLGNVTRESLCFEGNNGCDLNSVADRLRTAGFVEFVFLGLCDDDRDPRNNDRPLLLARKPNSGRWPTKSRTQRRLSSTPRAWARPFLSLRR